MQLVTLISPGPLLAASRMRSRNRACDRGERKVRDTQAGVETRHTWSDVLVYQSHPGPLEYFKSFILEINHIEVLKELPWINPLRTSLASTQSPTSYSNISAPLFMRVVAVISVLCRLTESRGAGSSYGPNSSRG